MNARTTTDGRVTVNASETGWCYGAPSRPSMSRRARHLGALLALAVSALLLPATAAGAKIVPVPGRAAPGLRAGTEMTMSGTGNGQGVTGFIANAGYPFDPATDPYPPANPTTGFSPKDEGFAGIIHGSPTDGSPRLDLYCIDINTNTQPGITYALGTWNEANVPNVGFVGRILDEYFPNTDEPTALRDANQKAAAVQAAIWFFSDRYVLSTSDPLRSIVVSIVNKVKSEGPLVEPEPPSLTLTPSHQNGHAGGVIGPFTVATNATRTTMRATGGAMFSDAAGTRPIANGATVGDGDQIWVRSTGPSTVVLEATAKASVPYGNVFLYAGNNPGVTDAQKLILAKNGTLTTTVEATAEFLAPGSLIVTKTIAGPAAGKQSEVVIHVACDDDVRRPDLVIPAGTHAGETSKTYHNIPAGTPCTVTETVDGSNTSTTVVVSGDNGQQATIPAGGSATAGITDTYGFAPGSLLVRKTIAGPGAGRQGPITIRTKCDGNALTPDFVVAAGAPAGDRTKQYDGIATPATCTVTETVDGHTSQVSVVVDGSGQTVPVGAGAISEADIADSYGLVPGQLEVTKTIEGAAAGQQGTVVIHTVCQGTALTPDFVIAAGTAAGVQSQIYSNVPAGTCEVTETADGHTATVAVSVTGSPNTTTVPAGGAGTVHITDTYGATPPGAVAAERPTAPGSLQVTKTIGGPLAGRQGVVRIRVVCDGTALTPDFVIAAKTSAGSVSRTFDGIPAGSGCAVTEIANGATATVVATVVGSGRTVIVPGGTVATVHLMNVYGSSSGVLRVTKTIGGPAARLHGRIAILATCGGRNAFVFSIPAHRRSGTVSRSFAGLPAGSRCRVIEVVTGHNRTAILAGARTRQRVTIRAGGIVTAHLIDRFELARVVPDGLG